LRHISGEKKAASLPLFTFSSSALWQRLWIELQLLIAFHPLMIFVRAFPQA
jgi:hypothetical protein